MVIEFNNESMLTDICRDSFELKSLEYGPIEEILVGRSKLSKVLDYILVVVTIERLLLCGRKLRSRVLADHFV